MTASLRMLHRPKLPPRSAAIPSLCGDQGMATLKRFMENHRRIVVLTGAGCSTESGIPDYRDATGGWKGSNPVFYQEFIRKAGVRRRYWARSLVGWTRVTDAQPNAAHHCLARLEADGRIRGVITQNVDALHHRAGSRRVIDLHGRLDRVECLDCRALHPRGAFQETLLRANPDWRNLTAETAPDGDARLDGLDFSGFSVPPCQSCGGTLKPGVVFFGESVPKSCVSRALTWLEEADALLVVGSSLMVWSGYRFARTAAARGLPIGAINLGRTRADDLLTFKVAGSCAEILGALDQLPPW